MNRPEPASFYTDNISRAYYHCIQDLENHQKELEQFMDWLSPQNGMPPVISRRGWPLPMEAL